MPGEEMIRVEGLYKSFGENHVLRGVDLVVPTGTTTVILGGSGTGKSVLMKHLIGLSEPDAGRVLIDGQDLSELSGEALTKIRGMFGMVFQGGALFDSMTVFDNVAFPLKEHRRELSEAEVKALVHDKLALFGLEGSEQKYPADISGGMRKRVGLARATILDPKIVLYDEPTTGLDPLTTDDVDSSILKAKAELGVTSVVISHDIDSAFRVADQIAFLYEGRVVVHGGKEALLASEHPFVRRFLSRWSGVEASQPA